MTDDGRQPGTEPEAESARRRYDSEAETRASAPPRPDIEAEARDEYVPSDAVEAVRGDPDEVIRVGTGSTYAREETVPLQSRTVGRYRIVKLISHGGMSSVYQAIDPHMDRLIALKICRVTAEDAESDLRRFRTEVRSSARLNHPNIVRILDSGSSKGMEFFAMEFIDGQTLGDYVREHRPPFRQRAVLMRDVAEAVQHAHECGILHRDIKPGNVILDQAGVPHVTDFGLAKQLGASFHLTLAGEALGTPNYMPPEQAAGKQDLIGFESDVWSLGAVLYEVLTRRPPFDGESAHEVLRKVLDSEPEPPRAINESIPRELELITLKCLEKPIGRRYRTAIDLAADLNRYITGGVVEAKPPSLLYRSRKFALRHRLALGIVALILSLATILSAVMFNLKQRQESVWRLAANHSLLAGAPEAAAVLRADLQGPGSPPPADPLGLRLPAGQWLWFERPALLNDVRVEVDVVWTRVPDGIQIAINANRETTAAAPQLPQGYIATYHNVSGGNCDILRVQQGPEVLHRAPLAGQSFGVARLIFQRRGTLLQLFHDGALVEEVHDILPLAGSGHDQVGLRCLGGDMRVRRVRIHRLPLPELSPPLVAGDALANHGNWRGAADHYLTVHQDFAGSAFIPEALAKAYFCALRAETPALAARAERLLAEEHPASPMRRFVLEEQIRRLWIAGKQTDALELVAEVLALDPSSRILEFLLENRDRPLLSPSRRRLFELLPRCSAALNLDLTGLGLEDLDFLAGVRLRSLDVSRNRIEDLGPLIGTGLTTLICRHNRIYELGPLDDLPLVVLDCSYNPITSLAPLAGSGLQHLEVRGTAISDLGPLAELPLKAVRVDHTPIPSLTPLRALRLNELGVAGTLLTELGPLNTDNMVTLDISGTAIAALPDLADGQLRRLNCADTPLDDLRALAGTGLRTLDCSRIRARDFSPLAGLPLAELHADETALSDLARLGLDRLERLSVAGTPLTDLGPLADSRLYRLDASRTPVADLSPLAGTTLRELAIARSEVTDLAPLAGLNLARADLAHTRIADLGPLAGSRLDHLDLTACPIADLTPLSGQRPRILYAADTRLTDCRPLLGTHLRALDLSGLAPTHVPQEATVLLDPLRCPPELLAALLDGQRVAILNGKVDPQALREAHRRRDPSELLDRCPVFRDHRYLLLPGRHQRSEAVELAAAWGGEMLTLDDIAEADFVAGRFGAWPVWARITDYHTMLARRAPGAPLQPADDQARWQDHLEALEPAVRVGHWRPARGEKRLLVVEFDR